MNEHTLVLTYHCYYAPAPRVGGIKRWWASDVCLSVCRVHRASVENREA